MVIRFSLPGRQPRANDWSSAVAHILFSFLQVGVLCFPASTVTDAVVYQLGSLGAPAKLLKQ